MTVRVREKDVRKKESKSDEPASTFLGTVARGQTFNALKCSAEKLPWFLNLRCRFGGRGFFGGYKDDVFEVDEWRQPQS